MSNVACEGSHMKDFGGIGLVNRNHLPSDPTPSQPPHHDSVGRSEGGPGYPDTVTN